MKELEKMQYKSFVFPSNPSKLKTTGSRRLKQVPVITGGTKVFNASAAPIKISGSGHFFGGLSVQNADKLHHLLSENDSGWLFVPNSVPICAFFESFETVCDTKNNCVSYKFSFIEDCSNRKYMHDFGYTVAQDGENVFDIAYRTKSSVDRIMEKNEFITPFDVPSGGKVVLI